MRPLFLLALIGLSACSNPCQDLCVRMAEVAADTCGLTVPTAQLTQCSADFKAPTFDERKTCRRSNSAEDILSTWSCDDLSDYFALNNG